MKIALIGYGKMGKAIERIALSRGHEIALKINRSNLEALNEENLSEVDLAIEFTNPEAALDNVLLLLKAGVPVVCGSTGWNDGVRKAQEYCHQRGGALLQASNFSVGVNLFFELNEHLAVLMKDWPEYEPRLEEVHHTEKKDAPSGTAIALAEQMIEALGRKKNWQLVAQGQTGIAEGTLPVTALREDEVPGTHTVTYSSPIDDIQITHTARSREGFAQGAVLAAEFLLDKKGVFTMKDVLALPQRG